MANNNPLGPREPHPAGPNIANGNPPLTKACKGTLPPSPPPSPPNSKRTADLFARTFNTLLIQVACHLACHGADIPPTNCPIDLTDTSHPLLLALDKADKARSIASARGRFDLVAKGHLFRGHVYRAMGIWDMAYQAYVWSARCCVFNNCGEGIEELTRFCAAMRDGRRLSEQLAAAKSVQTENKVIKGLFRCGTSGPLDVAVQSQGVIAEHPAGNDGQELAQRTLEEEIVVGLGLVEEESQPKSGWRTRDDRGDAGQAGGDGQGDIEEESEIDWIGIGSCGSSIYDPPHHLQVPPRPGYPPLRSVQGRFVPRGKLWAEGERLARVTNSEKGDRPGL